MTQRIDFARTWETLTLNAQKGEAYRIKFVDDPEIYEGIPVLRPGEAVDAETRFRFDVTAPRDRAGLVDRAVGDIEWLERVR